MTTSCTTKTQKVIKKSVSEAASTMASFTNCRTGSIGKIDIHILQGLKAMIVKNIQTHKPSPKFHTKQLLTFVVQDLRYLFHIKYLSNFILFLQHIYLHVFSTVTSLK